MPNTTPDEAAQANHDEKLSRARAVLEKARAEMGDDLAGFSIVDLLADNFPWSLAQCREIARELTQLERPICHNADDELRGMER